MHVNKSEVKYDWGCDRELPSIENHSLTKLDILSRYISIYLEVYLQNPHIRNVNLTIVDGFAGGGLYKNEIKGSPLRIYDAIESAKKIATIRREQNKLPNVDFSAIEYFFVEKRKSSFYFLENILQEFGYDLSNVKLINKPFKSVLPKLLDLIDKRSRNGRSIFVLDQYGYMGASISMVKEIFCRLQKAEVILTFSTDSLIDYLTKQRPQTLIDLGISKEDAEHILDVRCETDFTRAKIQPLLYKSIVEAAGAKFYTPFFIKTDNSNRTYWLFHFSTNARARDEMIKLHWEVKNTFLHYGGAGLKMFGFNSSYNKSLLGDPFLFDESAEAQTLNALKTEIPEKIFENGSMTFEDLKNQVINHTPAKIEMMKEALSVSIEHEDVVIISKDGSRRKKYTTIKDDDMISPNKTKLFYIGKS